MEQVRLVKALEPDVEMARDADKAGAVWAGRSPRAPVGNVCARSAAQRPPTRQDNPAME